MKVIYIDVLFIVNLIPDYLLLRLTSVLRGVYPKTYRTLLGAVFGAAAAIPLYFIPLGIYGSFIAKAAVCFLICLITFGRHKTSGSCLIFTGMSFAFAGAVSILCWLGISDGISVQGGTVYANLSLPLLLCATVFAYCVVRLIFGHGDAGAGGKSSDIAIVFRGQSIKLRAFQDSGNNLREPFTGRRVIVVSPDVCSELFNRTERDIITSGASGAALLESLSELSDCASAFSLIPYSTASGDGLMLIFRPDSIIVDGKKSDHVIGIGTGQINAAGNCHAIIGV